MMIDVARPPERRLIQGSLPIVALGGRWGKTTTARLLEAMLRGVNARLALWLDQGVWVNGRRQTGELIPWGEAMRALATGDLDLAIQELDGRTVVAAGLPSAAYGLGIITSFCGNDEVCLTDPRSLIERQAQSAVARAIHPQGALVLNADDLAVAEESRATVGEPIYYGMSRRNPIIKAHLAEGHRAVCISSGMIVLCDGRRTIPVLPTREVALALGGTIVFQVQNALAAAAAAWHLGVAPEQIAATLRTFTSNPTNMPGSCNQFVINGATVIVDRIHDAVSTRALLRGLRKVPGRRRRRVLLAATPKLDVPAAAEIGRLLGRTFDQVVLHHPPDHQETVRHPAEGLTPAEALRAGIALNPVPPVVLALPDEAVALEKLLQIIGQNDLALILADDLSMILRTLLTYGSGAAYSRAGWSG